MRTDRVTLTFSEAVDVATLQRALSVIPQPEEPPRVRVSGREATVVFADSLAPDRTVVLTLGTELTDTRGVALQQPITLAFSTGDRLDRGRIEGRVARPADGAPVGSVAVLAYRLADSTAALPDPRSARPDYLTETGSDGRFRLDYLSDAPFYVIALEDRNRNRRADPGERFGVPTEPRLRAQAPAPPRRAPRDSMAGGPEEEAPSSPPLDPAPPDSLGTDTLAVPLARPPEALLYIARLDTIPPRVRRTRAVAADRFEVRFDEAIAALDPEAWATTDSLGGETVPVRGVFRAPLLPTAAVVLTEARPGRVLQVRLGAGAARDSAGLGARDTVLSFEAGPEPDTTALRLDAFLPAGPDSVAIRLDQPPGFRLTLPLGPEQARDRTALLDAAGAPRAFTLTREGALAWRVVPEGGWRPGLDLRLRVRLPDSTYTRRIVTPDARTLGEIVGTVAGAPAGTPVVVEAYPEDDAAPPFRAVPDAAGGFRIPAIPSGTYRLRAWLDLDGDGRWTGGRLAPYTPPEPLYLSDAPTTVTSRFETAVEITLPDR